MYIITSILDGVRYFLNAVEYNGEIAWSSVYSKDTLTFSTREEARHFWDIHSFKILNFQNYDFIFIQISEIKIKCDFCEFL